MEQKHTPGPWFISNMAPCPSSRTVIMAKRNGGACGVADVYLPPYPDGGEANANLIAAAPELLEALEEIMFYDGGAVDALHDPYVNERAINALDKARGENQ